jgi:RimJ/RimL family protein N-acetyltransferase
MHSELNQLIAQEHIADLRAAAERSRRATGDRLELEDGRRLRIRPIEREDRDRFRGLFARLAPESRYRRYFSPKPQLSERELSYLVDVDHVQHEALAAVDETDDSFVAAARYVQPPDQPGVAEVAIEVSDDLHRQGIGTALALRTLERARANGFTRVVATTLRENAAARALLRQLNFRPRASCGPEIELELELKPGLAVQPCPGGPELGIPEEKRELIERASETVVAVEGEALRPLTTTAITETRAASGRSVARPTPQTTSRQRKQLAQPFTKTAGAAAAPADLPR